LEQRNEKDADGDEERNSGSEPVKAVNQVKGVGHSDNPQDGEQEAP